MFESEVTIEEELTGFVTPEVDGVELYAKTKLDGIEGEYEYIKCYNESHTEHEFYPYMENDDEEGASDN